VQITVGNTAPTVNLTRRPTGSCSLRRHRAVPGEVTDPEDGTIDCSRVKVTYLLGHDSHAHQITSQTGCSGSITVPVDGEHDAAANIFGVFDAEYTDNGGLTTHKQHIAAAAAPAGRALRRPVRGPARSTSRRRGRPDRRDIDNGDWISFTPYALSNATSFTARVSSAGAGGTLEVRAGSPTGTLLGSAPCRSPAAGTRSPTCRRTCRTRRPARPRCTWCSPAAPAQPVRRRRVHLPAAADAPYDVLVFSKTAGFRHDSIPAGIQAIRELGAANNFTVTATEDAAAFTTANLAQYEAVVFLNTTGDVLNDTQQAAFESYIRGGGGYVGVHAAADTEYDWPFYGNLVGAYFASHPAIQQATVRVEDRAHPATAHLRDLDPHRRVVQLPDQPALTAHVLATLDESSTPAARWAPTTRSPGARPSTGRPVVLHRLGHTIESYAEPASGQPPARRHPVRGRPDEGRLPAGDRLHHPLQRIHHRLVAGRPGGFTNTDATLTSVGGMGMLWYSAKEFGSYSLKLDWRITGDDNSGVFVGFPAEFATRTRRSTTATRSRSTPPTPPTDHRVDLRLQGPPTSPPATPRSTRPASGTPTRSWSRASGCRSS
jgi:type 1 glutamine amidotransferase